jgi:hypothetical protein
MRRGAETPSIASITGIAGIRANDNPRPHKGQLDVADIV